MCFELTNMMSLARTITAAELEKLLADLDVDVLADTIEQYWNPADRFVVLDWIGGMLAARKLDDQALVPNMPEVLVPFYDASAKPDEMMVVYCTACQRNITVEREPQHECSLCGAGVEFLTDEKRPTNKQISAALTI